MVDHPVRERGGHDIETLQESQCLRFILQGHHLDGQLGPSPPLERSEPLFVYVRHDDLVDLGDLARSHEMTEPIKPEPKTAAFMPHAEVWGVLTLEADMIS